ncbi:MAG: YjjG family noncanonical pyrimidine nucleotidase [Spirochaetota bacterium]
MPHRYDVVLLDADDTLLDFYRAETYALESTLSAYGYDEPVETHLEAFRRINTIVWREYESGESTSEQIRVKRFALLLAELNGTHDPNEVSEHYLDRLSESTFMVAGARELLESLCGRVPLGLVTNGIGKVQRSRLARTGVGDYFQTVVISEDVGVQKPDPRIFEMALDRIGSTSGDRVIMIGDGLHSDITGAIAAGIDSCWFNLRERPVDPDVDPTYTITSLNEVYGILGLD